MPYSGSGGAHTVRLAAASNAGWTFQRWAGCGTFTGATCYLDVPSGGSGPHGRSPRDLPGHRHTAGVRVQRAAIGRRRGTLHGQLDRQRARRDFQVRDRQPGGGRLRVRLLVHAARGQAPPARDARGPQWQHGPDVEAKLDVVDTVLDEAPTEGAYAATWRFAAHTGFGTAIECSLDGGAWFDCGGASGPLTLPSLADGRHTLRARGVGTTAVDRFPAIRTWTVDTTAPDTTMTGLQDRSRRARRELPLPRRRH